MMKKLYEKSELGFALVWIGIYCVGMSIFDEISRSIGVKSTSSQPILKNWQPELLKCYFHP